LESLNLRYRFVNDGDDGVIIISRKDLGKLEGMYEWYEQYGYKMQAETPVDVLEEVEFCQCRPVWDGEKWLMCRNPDVVLNRDTYTTKSVQTIGQWNYYRGAIGNCGIAAAGGMPVVGAFYEALARGAKDVRSDDTSTGLYWMALGQNRTNQGIISAETRVSFFKAFGYTPDQQIRMEAEYKLINNKYHPSGVHQYFYR
jgi:hypothetical protein